MASMIRLFNHESNTNHERDGPVSSQNYAPLILTLHKMVITRLRLYKLFYLSSKSESMTQPGTLFTHEPKVRTLMEH
ncbi:hypothetical protein K439DRAFT_1636335 [Ramaria rubella]|nr:hypothetical protein K439DRAFT_1636335 [Ramaria rubella]